MSKRKKTFWFNGKEYGAEDLAVINNIAIATVFTRLERNPNATFEEVTAPAKKKNPQPLDMEKERKVIINGAVITLREAAERYRQDYRHLVYRYERGARGDRVLRTMHSENSKGAFDAASYSNSTPRLLCGRGGHYTMDELLEIYSGCRDSEDVGIIMCDFACIDYSNADWLINELEIERDKRRMGK